MMISLFFPFIILKPPLIISGLFSDPPSRGVDLSKENIIACISKVTHQCRWSYFDLGPHSRASYLEHQPKHASSMQPMR